jgi:hypothetical protein
MCDNVKNNDTMLDEFAWCYQLKTGTCFDVKHRHIRCLVHIINLATQSVISARTKSKYYNGDPSDDHMPEDNEDSEHDEIGIVQAICIKVSSTVVLFLVVFYANLRVL